MQFAGSHQETIRLLRTAGAARAEFEMATTRFWGLVAETKLLIVESKKMLGDFAEMLDKSQP